MSIASEGDGASGGTWGADHLPPSPATVLNTRAVVSSLEFIHPSALSGPRLLFVREAVRIIV